MPTFRNCLTGAALLCGATANLVIAGPVIIDGTDANDHGFFDGSQNQQGWAYMESALQNLGGQVGNGNKTVVDLGTSGDQAGDAIASAFNLSSLPGAGWTRVNIDGAANIASFLAGGTVNGANLANTGVIYIPTYGNTAGDLTDDEMAAVNGGAAAIASFVGGAGDPSVGGGLFSMAESGTGAYGWLTTLIPGLIATDLGGGGVDSPIALTPAGTTAFPALPPSDVAEAIPWHGYFSGNLGSLSVLGTALDDSGVRQNVILGGGAGTIIDRNPVPETLPGWAVTSALGAVMAAGAKLRRRVAK